MSNETRPVKGRSGQTRRAAEPTKKSSSGLDLTTLMGIGVIVAVIGLAAYFVFGSGGNTPAANAVQESADVTVEGEALPQFNAQNPGEDQALGMAAPQVTGEDFAADEVTLLTEGEANILVFLAHWCPHCQAETPLLVDEWSSGLPDNVNVTAVVTAQDANQPNYPPSTWLDREDWTHPVILDSEANDIAGAYGLTSYPFFVVTDAEGNVVARTSGELGREQIQNLVDVAEGAADASTVQTDEDSSDVE
ncbi:TlpA family protein disulfide reductase [Salsipaludibacter albus]|uniref:TlpA family protein disulfide reductase n=1 Tax=Salsipaludibacter albus TaxID=2849650 RepID=UPI001EE3EFA3|nr:TlpA disulfide reductase family protein [Salsipaludibacter albus]MBY5160887.1 TlpA family protein disulfide reductase [Salsipaludibacter albus]